MNRLKLGDGTTPFRAQIVKDLRGEYHIITALHPTKNNIVCDYTNKYRPDMLFSIPEGDNQYEVEIEIDAGDGIKLHSIDTMRANSLEELYKKLDLKFKEMKEFTYYVVS